MNKNHNSSELAKQVSEKLKLNQENRLRLYKELSQIPNGIVKDILSFIVSPEVTNPIGTLKLNLSCPNCGNTTWTQRTDGDEVFFECLACGDMCNPENMCTDVVELPAEETKSTLTKYVACIKGTCVRDAQYSKWEGATPMDEDAWVNGKIDETPIFLEIVEAETQTRAKQIAAAHMGVTENVIELYPVS